jgi:hypothetical protein
VFLLSYKPHVQQGGQLDSSVKPLCPGLRILTTDMGRFCRKALISQSAIW